MCVCTLAGVLVSPAGCDPLTASPKHHGLVLLHLQLLAIMLMGAALNVGDGHSYPFET
jgi:hypothetical protein